MKTQKLIKISKVVDSLGTRFHLDVITNGNYSKIGTYTDEDKVEQVAFDIYSKLTPEFGFDNVSIAHKEYNTADLKYNPGRKTMKFLTKELERKIPPLYSQENKGEDAIVYVHFFTPWTSWDWYITEKTGDTMFGLVHGHEDELGYVSLKELESIRGPAGLRIERDLHFRPAPLSECRSKNLNPKKQRRNPKVNTALNVTNGAAMIALAAAVVGVYWMNKQYGSEQ